MIGGARRWIAVLALIGAGGCYTYEPLAAPPSPGTPVGMTLNDQGRAELGPFIGSEILRIDGTVVDVNDSGYRLAMRETVGLRGVRSSWAGEAVDFRRDYVQSIDQRRLSRPRTLVAVLGGALALTALFATDLFGFGGSETDALPPGGGGNGQ